MRRSLKSLKGGVLNWFKTVKKKRQNSVSILVKFSGRPALVIVSRISSRRFTFNNSFINIVQFVLVFYFFDYEPLTVYGYEYPFWANVLGWILCMIPFLCVPGWAIFEVYRGKGSLAKVSSFVTLV